MRSSVFSAIAFLASVLAAPVPTPADNSLVSGEPGFWLMNKASEEGTYYYFNNNGNGCGTGDPNFKFPDQSVTLQPGELKFIPMDIQSKGRWQKGPKEAPSPDDWWNIYMKATWVEAQLTTNPDCPNHDGGAHGDVSLQVGYDVPAVIHGTMPGSASNGFTTPINIPDGAGSVSRPDGSKALDGKGNAAAVAVLNAIDGLSKKAYVGDSWMGVPDVASSNNILAIDFY